MQSASQGEMLKLNNRTITLLCLVLLFAIVTNFFIDHESASNTKRQTTGNDPDVYMQNATITQYADDGFKHHQIFAERFNHFPLTDVTTLYTPNMTLFSTEGNQPWEITAKHGRLLPKTVLRDETVELWGQVQASQQAGNGNLINIQTSSLTIYPDNDYAETDQQVIIDNQMGHIRAAGMKVYFAQGHFLFFSFPEGKAPGGQTERKRQRVQTIVFPEVTQGAK